MHIIAAIIIGFIVGIIARLIMPGRSVGGFLMTTLLGIGGAVMAKLIGQALGWYGSGEPAGFIASVIGAMLILLIYNLITRPRTRAPTEI